MFYQPGRVAVATSPTHDAFQLAFNAFDVFSGFLMPGMKGVGRLQLEMAHLGAQQNRAYMDYARQVMRCKSPVEFAAETMNFWQQLSANLNEAGQNIASATARAVPPSVTFAAPFEVLPMPAKRARDLLRLKEQDEPELPFERRVA